MQIGRFTAEEEDAAEFSLIRKNDVAERGVSLLTSAATI